MTSKKIHKYICPHCGTQFTDPGFNACLLDCEPMRFCSKKCWRLKRAEYMHKRWVGSEKYLSKYYPEEHAEWFGGVFKFDADELAPSTVTDT